MMDVLFIAFVVLISASTFQLYRIAGKTQDALLGLLEGSLDTYDRLCQERTFRTKGFRERELDIQETQLKIAFHQSYLYIHRAVKRVKHSQANAIVRYGYPRLAEVIGYIEAERQNTMVKGVQKLQSAINMGVFRYLARRYEPISDERPN